MRGREVSELLDGNFKSLNTDIQSLEKQLKDRGYVIINYIDNVSATRLSIPSKIRRSGLTVTYNVGSGWIQEQYIVADTTDDAWQEDENWKSIGGIGSGFWVDSNTDFTDKTSAHNAVKKNERMIGMYISYRLSGTWITEQYVGIDTSKDNWENPDNWNILTYNEQIAEIAAQAQKLGQEAKELGEKAVKIATDAANEADIATDRAHAAAKEVENLIEPFFPVNTILGTTAEAGNIFGDKWLLCDGSAVSRINYPDLKTKEGDNTWKEAGSITAQRANGIVFGKNVYVCLAYDDISENRKIYIYYSFDLQSWHKSLELNTLKNYLGAIYFLQGCFFCVVQNENRSVKILKSLDGVKWDVLVESSTVIPFNYYPFEHAAYGNGKYIISLYDSVFVYDGITGKVIDPSYQLSNVYYGNGVFVSYANRNIDKVPCWSIDGETWMDGIINGDFKDNNAYGYAIVFDGSAFTALFLESDDNLLYMLTSSDGKTWNFIDFKGSYNVYNIVYGNGVYVCGIYNGVMWSEDLINWTEVVLDGDAAFLKFEQGLFYADAVVEVESPNSYISSDGKTWKEVNEGLTQEPGDVVINDGYMVAIEKENPVSFKKRLIGKLLPLIENHYIKALK